jgi:hypothetical protein
MSTSPGTRAVCPAIINISMAKTDFLGQSHLPPSTGLPMNDLSPDSPYKVCRADLANDM